MNKTLQEIEDYYFSQGLRDEALRTALEKDAEYQGLLKERKAQVRNKYDISQQEEKKFLLPNEADYKILSMIKALENKALSDHDKEVIEIIKAQLLDDWRTPLLEKLRSLQQKYSKSNT